MVVVGGGIAGAVSSALLAKAGVPTKWLAPASPLPERSASLDGSTVKRLDEALGLGPALLKAGVAHLGESYLWGARQRAWALPGAGGVHLSAPALRQLLTDAAHESGVQIEHGRATVVLAQDQRVLGVRTEHEDHEATVVMDATGNQALLGRHLGTTHAVADRRLVCSWGLIEGGGDGRRRVIAHADGWLVSAPSGPAQTCIGFVSDTETPDLPRFQRLLAAADLSGPMTGELQVAHHPALTHQSLAGDGWFLLGEAGCFVDPVFGRGLAWAVSTAAEASRAVLRGLDGGPPVLLASGEQYSRGRRAEYRSWLRLARYWYRNNPAVPGPFWNRQVAHDVTPGNTEIRAFVTTRGGSYSPDPLCAVVPPDHEKAMFSALGVTNDQVKRARQKRRPEQAWSRRDEEGGTRVNLPSKRGQPGKRVELFIASGCNLHCAFCCESDRIQRKAFMPWEELDKKLVAAAGAGIDVIQFMGGEATLHPRFPDALKRAKELGLGTYVITNLMRWQRRDFAEAVGPWLDEVMVSMHAGDAETGATVTGVSNWWKGFQVAAENAQDTLQGRVRASTVLTRHNVDHLEAIAGALLKFHPHAWVMGCAVPVEGTRVPAEDLNLTLTELKALRPRFEALSKRCAEAGCKLVFFSMPHCVLGPSLWDDSHDLWVGDQDLTDAAPSDADTVTFWSQADDLPRTRPVTLARTRAEECGDCSRKRLCGGHFAAYLRRHGAHELEPIHA